jgi:hypothetical protein
MYAGDGYDQTERTSGGYFVETNSGTANSAAVDK